MLKHISLHCINQIFETEALIKTSTKARVAYMQCLIYHFDGMEPSHENLAAFDIMKFRVKPKSMPLFEELAKAGLVQIHEKWITFISVWRKYIDKTDFKRISPTEALGNSEFKPAEEFMEDVLKNQSFFELTQMQLKIDEHKTTELIKIFFKAQDAHEQGYPNYTSASRHCFGWIRGQVTGSSNYKPQTKKTNNATQRIEPGKNYGSL